MTTNKKQECISQLTMKNKATQWVDTGMLSLAVVHRLQRVLRASTEDCPQLWNCPAKVEPFPSEYPKEVMMQSYKNLFIGSICTKPDRPSQLQGFL